ncbi:NADH-quinone oxidoreductase subunit L [Acetonema longum]|uniref:Proton-translocating NADH-ubiquinone oxidoreductase, chain l n=1 Tax=Acetonema longum DSM 6540 TaxID=1009370 RepID=F7NDE7_9FIRM|nr:NADH-quinone oxidoreductase subunit L [Acetonema longum]EGO65979.1 proton-translocating NADH-ubiquinone oxidoreductase, chain l [Acetonema longum DSM 6540]
MLDYALHHAWLIPLLPAIGFVLIVSLFYRLPRMAALTAVSLLFVSFLLALGVVGAVVNGNITVEQPFITRAEWFSLPGLHIDMGVLIDPVSAMMLFVVTLVATLVAIYSVEYMGDDPGFTRFFAYISLFAASMLGMIIAVNFLQLFVFWELVGLCSYLLIGFYFYKVSAREAAKKAFMTTRIGDFGLLLGILLLQITFGTLDFAQLSDKIPAYISQHGGGLLTLAAVLVFVGPIGKSGQFPLHVWLPDAMEGPTPVSALIHAATMVVAGVYLVARAFMLFSALPGAMTVVAWGGGFTALFAASIALTQREIKRILAYSTVSQLGYMMLALGVGSLTASMFHLMTHAFFKALLFLGAGAVMHALHDQADIFKMGGLRHKMPVTCITMGIGVLAIAGIPPFAGFFSKDEILLAVSHVSMPLYIIASLTAFMTAFYMSRLYFAAFFGPEKPENHPHEPGGFILLPLVVLAFLAVVGGIVPYLWGFGDWVRFGPAHHAGIDPMVAGVSTVLAVLAIGFAWMVYGSGAISSDKLASQLRPLYTLSFHKYYIDEIYQWFNQTVVTGIGKILYWVDLYIVDGVVNNLAAAAGVTGNILRRAQTGQVQHYALVYFAAAVGLVLLMVFSGQTAQTAFAWLGGAL